MKRIIAFSSVEIKTLKTLVFKIGIIKLINTTEKRTPKLTHVYVDIYNILKVICNQ